MTAVEILDIKLTKLAITLTDDEKTLALNETSQVILNYCNLDSIPDGLTYTWVNMTLDLIRYEEELYASPTDVDIDVDSVDSIKVGDTSISLKGGNKSSDRVKLLNSHSTNLDGLVMNYRDQLNAFRRMVW